MSTPAILHEKHTLPETESLCSRSPQKHFKLLYILLWCTLLAFLPSLCLPACVKVLNSLKDVGDKHEKAIGTVTWYKCGTQPGVECGSVVVPRDYFNISNGTSTIALGRYKATKFPKKGTVILQPGGPGIPGTPLATHAGSMYAEMIGPYYDLVGFDPRGVGQTTPKVQCFPSELDRATFVANTVFEHGFTVWSNLSDPRTRDHLIAQYREFIVMKEAQAKLCASNMGEELRYMGTATVVRDIDFMTRTFEGDNALINFFGGSYGSIVGAYLVNMFPDRIGRVAVDGIVNPILWAEKPFQYWHRGSLSSTEDTYKIFLDTCCRAGPEICSLAQHAEGSPKMLEHRIDEFLDKLREEPLPVPFARRPGYLTAGGIQGLLFKYMTVPRMWPKIAKGLAEAMSGNGTAMFNLLLPTYDLERLAVTCLDAPRPAKKSEFPSAEELADFGLGTLEISRHFGMSIGFTETDGGCEFWPVRGPERFTGPFNHTLRNPILIVSNTADPVTPIASGRLLNSLLGNSSRLLIQNSPGHCSFSQTSLCTTKAYKSYFTHGTLPPNEFVCDVDEHPFPPVDDTRHVSTEDARLLRKAQELGEIMEKVMTERTIGV